MRDFSAGSCQIDDSIGSSVNDTNSDTSTAAVTVMPNAKKNLPMMPLMNATGTNTATIANVVAITASPISLVPSSAAWRWLLPIRRCRTMFSRTTIASSIRRPMQSDSAIIVMKFSVKPKAFSTMNVDMTAIGSVRPVMIVERQLRRNRNTISTVSRPPSISVCLTPSSDRSTQSEFAYSSRISTPGGRRFARLATAAFTALPVSTMFASWILKTCSDSAGCPSLRPYDCASCSPSVTVAIWLRNTGASPTPDEPSELMPTLPPRRATMTRPKSSMFLIFPSTRTSVSLRALLMRPAGTSWLACRIASIT